MGLQFRSWVAFGDLVTVFGQHCPFVFQQLGIVPLELVTFSDIKSDLNISKSYSFGRFRTTVPRILQDYESCQYLTEFTIKSLHLAGKHLKTHHHVTWKTFHWAFHKEWFSWVFTFPISSQMLLWNVFFQCGYLMIYLLQTVNHQYMDQVKKVCPSCCLFLLSNDSKTT